MSFHDILQFRFYFIEQCFSNDDGSISIYWGCDSVFEYINKDRVIYIPDYTDSELLEKIKQLNENEELYNSIIEKPIYVNGKNDKMIFKEYQNNINKILHLNK